MTPSVLALRDRQLNPALPGGHRGLHGPRYNWRLSVHSSRLEFAEASCPLSPAHYRGFYLRFPREGLRYGTLHATAVSQLSVGAGDLPGQLVEREGLAEDLANGEIESTLL